MEHLKPKARTFGLNLGLILGLVMVAISVILYVTGMALEGVQWPIYIYYILFPAIIIYGIIQFKKENANILGIRDALKVGLAIATVSALVYAFYVILFNYVIDPDFVNQSLQVAREKLSEDPNLTEEQLELSMSLIEKSQDPILGSAGWLAVSIFFGFIYSLIGGLVMKNNS